MPDSAAITNIPGACEGKVLVIDLDGTLLDSDMLYETFWAAFAKRIATPLIALRALLAGKTGLKEKLAEISSVDPGLLPFNEEVIRYADNWRKGGGRVVLATASHRQIAQNIADHLGIFDEVHGSDSSTNLKGARKAELLSRTYGEGGFSYAGNDHADLPVWRDAEAVVAVNAPGSVRSKLQSFGKPVEYIENRPSLAAALLRVLRPHQWLKNALVFVPAIAAHQLDASTLFTALVAFISFSLIASAVYVLNDLLDLAADRAHPRKCKRPFASGSLPLKHGTWIAPALFIAGFGIAFWVSVAFGLAMVGYFLLTTSYSLDLKRRLVIDICALTGLYTMRIIAGGVATQIDLSVWLLAFSLFFFFSLAAIKRQAELVDMANREGERVQGRGYMAGDLAIVSQMAISAGFVSVLVLALYLNSPKVASLYRYPEALWGICAILLYWISRIAMLTHRGHMPDDPVVFAVKDKKSLACGVAIAVCLGAGMAL